ncbi:MAG: FAD-binding oxidoreductase [Gammaproteobacteria bacterium]|nr:FAD-binding oxidoreductase [Gammaproteobacteria bacterium]
MNSYYTATAGPAPDFPRLQGDVTADVAILGGGYTGVNAAIELAERGLDVVLLEARRIGWGCSGRNGGQAIVGLAGRARLLRHLGPDGARRAWELGIEGLRIVRQRIEGFGIDCAWRPGYFAAACKLRQLDELKRECDQQHGLGYPWELSFVSRRDLPGVIGSRAYVGGVLDSGSGHLHPLNLCLGEARAAAGLGVRIYEQSPVEHVHHGANPSLQTPAGRVSARHLIIAGDAYLEGLVPELRGSVLPAGSYLIATEPLSTERARELLPLDCAVSDQNILLDYFRLSSDRRLLFGGRCNYTGAVPRDIAGTLRPRMERVFPQLRGARVDYEWGGTVGVSLKRIPQFGCLDGNVWYAQGYSGHGIVPAHVAGRLLAEAITGDRSRFDVFAGLRHLRLPGGRWFATPALALGMAWYRLLDML